MVSFFAEMLEAFSGVAFLQPCEIVKYKPWGAGLVHAHEIFDRVLHLPIRINAENGAFGQLGL